MITWLRIATVVTVLAVFGALAPMSPAGAATTEELVVQFAPGMPDSARTRAVGRVGGVVVQRVEGSAFAVVEVPVARAAALRTTVEGVVGVEPVGIMRMAATPNDPHYSKQWHMPMVQAVEAQEVSSGAGVTVAVIDSGIAYEDFELFRQAPDLATTEFVAGKDYVGNDDHPNDDNGHGTHVAGTIAQSTNNGVGGIGVAPGARLMPLKVLDAKGNGTDVNVAAALRFAADNGAKVANLSLGGPTGTNVLRDAVDYAVAAGVTIVAATGNAGGAVAYPAAYDSVIAVGAVDRAGRIATYSNRGPEVDLVAPGGDTDTDTDGNGVVGDDGVLQQTLATMAPAPDTFGYYYYQGTSMATPHVAGGAAIVIASGRATTPVEVKAALVGAATDLGTAGFDSVYGNGLMRIRDSINATVPPAPVDVTAVAGDASATVAWAPPATDGGSPILEYRVSGGPTPVIVPASSRSATVTGLTNGTFYVFTVAARNAVGWSAESAGSSTVTPAPTSGTAVAPDAPSDVTASAGDASASVSWSAPAFDGGSAIVEYRISGGSAPVFASASDRSATITGLENGFSYVFTLAARNAVGWSAESPASSAVTPEAPAAPPPASPPPPAPPAGYRFVASDGGIFSFGDAAFHGSPASGPIPAPIVGMAKRTGGYWLAAADGSVYAYGNATPHGAARGISAPIVAIAATPDGGGYWLVGANGAVYAFGNARFYGALGGSPLNRPIVGMASTPSGAGYWLVASDGGLFAYGDAGFYGSTGNIRLNLPIVGMTATSSGKGYWMVASDGGLFAFGDAGFYGSTGDLRLNRPVVGMASAPGGGGYWLVASDGGIFAFGSAGFHGSTGNIALNRPIVGMTPA